MKLTDIEIKALALEIATKIDNNGDLNKKIKQVIEIINEFQSSNKEDPVTLPETGVGCGFVGGIDKPII